MSAGNGATPPGLKRVRLADVQPEPVEWLWKPYIPVRKLTLVEGDPGIGKSWLTLALASAVSKGGIWFQIPMLKGKVLLLSSEDGLADSVRPRLDMLRANVENIEAIEETFTFDDKGAALLHQVMGDLKPRLVVVDPITAYTDAKTDIYRANQVRPLMLRFKRVAELHSSAVVLVRHLKKQRGGSPLHLGLGSVDFTAAVRSALLVGKHNGHIAMTHSKCNIAKKGPSLGYIIDNGQFLWLGEVDTTAEDIAAEAVVGQDKRVGDQAQELIREMLGQGQEVPSSELDAAAKQMGISRRTLTDARREMGVRARKGEGGVWWLQMV